MSKAKLVARVKALRKAGVPFRTIEAMFPKSIGVGNGTKALRLSRVSA